MERHLLSLAGKAGSVPLLPGSNASRGHSGQSGQVGTQAPAARRPYVVVSGPPASGKSTVAKPLARALRLPLVAKDDIKEALMDSVAVPDLETSRQLGRAAIAEMLALAASSPSGAVLDSNFDRTFARDELRRLPGCIVEVFCLCDPIIARERYDARTGGRHPGHFDEARPFDDLWNAQTMRPVAGGWVVVEVDTTDGVDLKHLLAAVQTASRAQGPSGTA
jgi:predicted kinase